MTDSNLPRTKTGEAIDWTAALAAYERLGTVINDVGFVAPENGPAQQKYLNRAAQCVSEIAKALKLLPSPTPAEKP